MTREEKMKAFEQAKVETKQKLKDKENKKSFTKSYEEIAYVGIQENKWGLGRILDGCYTPYVDNRPPTAPKYVKQSYIVNDSGKGFFCNWAVNNYDWFLWKVYNEVNKDIIEQDFPKLHLRVTKNNKENASPFEKGWYPKNHIVMNIIDRLDMDWHRKNKCSKLLSRKITQVNEKKYCDLGISPQVYDAQIYNKLIENYGMLDDYDIGFIKYPGTGGSQITFEFQHSKFLTDVDYLKDHIVNGYLTEEEESWKKYDLDKFYMVTSYHKIKKNLENFIKQVDANLNTKFHEELLDLVETEKKLFDELYGESNKYGDKEETSERPKSTSIPKEEVKTESESKSKPESKPELKEEVKEEIDTSVEAILKIAPHYNDISDDEKKIIKGVKNGSIVFDESAGKLYKCEDPEICTWIQPLGIKKCLKCGTVLEG